MPRIAPPRTPSPEQIALRGRAALNTRLPFRARDALAAGYTRRELASSRFRRLLPGVYIDSDVPVDEWILARAVLAIAMPEAFVSHHLAARLHGGIVPSVPLLDASVPPWRHRSVRAGVFIHHSPRKPVVVRGVPVTTPADTFIDLADALDLIHLVVLGDSLVRRGRVTVAQLVAAAASAPDRLRRRAERAAALVRAGVDSPMETRLRLLIVLAGLPEPQVNLVFRDEDGTLVRRIDLGYRDHRLGIEYDGRQHAESTRQWQGDIRRREEFDALGWRIITIVAADLYRTPSGTLERIVDAMRAQGMRVPRLSHGWCAYFADVPGS